jgi:hypothetical protein
VFYVRGFDGCLRAVDAWFDLESCVSVYILVIYIYVIFVPKTRFGVIGTRNDTCVMSSFHFEDCRTYRIVNDPLHGY